MFYLTTHSTHFIYGFMASDIWLRTILIVRKETRCRHIGYSYRLAARVLLYAPSHRQDNTYHGLCYTSRGALAGTRCTKGDCRIALPIIALIALDMFLIGRLTISTNLYSPVPRLHLVSLIRNSNLWPALTNSESRKRKDSWKKVISHDEGDLKG